MTARPQFNSPRSGSSVLDSIKSCRLLYSNPVKGESAVILLRSRLLSIAQRMGFSEIKRENMALVASEMVSNQIKHAGGKGMIQLWQQPGPTLDILALDFGPGIPNLHEAQQDGYSTANTLGKGLGSIQRLSDEVFVYTQGGSRGPVKRWSGTVVLARFHIGRKNGKPRGAGALRPEIGLFSRSLSDDRYNGDRIYLHRNEDLLRWLHLDGLGHGEIAQNTTSHLAGHLCHGEEPGAALMAVDRELAGTRGAVAVIGEIDLARYSIQVLGVGDMHAHIYDGEQMHSMYFAPGVLGREHKAPSVFREDIGRGWLVITASDGIRRNWDTASFPGLFHHHPQLIAYVLGNIMGRISDDQSVCVVRTD